MTARAEPVVVCAARARAHDPRDLAPHSADLTRMTIAKGDGERVGGG